MSLNISNVDVNFGPNINGSLVYIPVKLESNPGIPNNFQIVPRIIITNRNSSDITLSEIQFQIMNLASDTFTYNDTIPSGQPAIKSLILPTGSMKIRKLSIYPPLSCTIDLKFTEFPQSKQVNVPLVPFTGFTFWGKTRDLDFDGVDGEAWVVHWGSAHDNIQAFAYDCGVVKRVPQPNGTSSKWQESTNNPANNDDWFAWDKPVYSMTDGIVEVVRNDVGDNNTPEAPNPSDLHPGGTSLANEVIIRTPENLLIQYSHFRKGSILENIRVDAQIKAGQQIGNVGNSGRSSNPHIHVHIVQRTEIQLSIKDMIIKAGKGIPASIKADFFGKTKEAKISILLGQGLLPNYYWPFPLSFQNCFIADRRNDESLSESNWRRLDGSGPTFIDNETIIWPNSIRPRLCISLKKHALNNSLSLPVSVRNDMSNLQVISLSTILCS